jgi:hypothetical protein
MAKKIKKQEKIAKAADVQPYMVSESSYKEVKASTSSGSNGVRRNAASTIIRTDRYKNIDDGIIPFRYSTGIKNDSNLNIRDAVILCQKAYYNFAIFRNTIDLMTEFSCSDIYFTGGSSKSRTFFESLFRKININDLQDKFFREYYRSGNVFIYRFDTKISEEDVSKITQTFGLATTKAAVNLPSKYIILNPADIQIAGTINFSQRKYYKLLSDYELERLKSPKTDEDKEVLQSLPPETRKLIQQKAIGILTLPLEADRIAAVFYKKQDYEPFSVPMGFPVLEDINWKAEMKKMDMAVARTMQQAILLVTMGTDPEKGGVNQKNLESMQQLFANQSVGRVLIADYTTKAEFVIPNIGNLIGPEKYQVVDRDIQIGLNNILIGSEKFANQSIKVQVFIERLKQAREAFLNEFLVPEIRRISKDLGFKNFPVPSFEEVNLQDDAQYSRIYNRLIELGVLTPEEGVQAIRTGRLPTDEESVQSQQKFKDLKNQGLYQPIIGGAAGAAGRPSGSTGIPQSTKNIKPIGTSKAFSVLKIKDSILAAQNLEEEVKASLRKKFNIKKLNNQQKEMAEKISELIVANENHENWQNKISDYINEPFDKNLKQVSEIESLASEHQISNYLASLLYHSQTN